MIEAIHLGCTPVAPNRVAYPEYIPQQLLYDVSQPQQESTALANKLCHLLCSDEIWSQQTASSGLDVSGYLENQLIARYQAEINAL